jgi:hypothetical protein
VTPAIHIAAQVAVQIVVQRAASFAAPQTSWEPRRGADSEPRARQYFGCLHQYAGINVHADFHLPRSRIECIFAAETAFLTKTYFGHVTGKSNFGNLLPIEG